MRKNILKATLILSTTLSFSANANYKPVAYLGTKLGYGTAQNSVSIKNQGLNFSSEGNKDIAAKGFDGQIDLGGGALYGANNKFYTGLEAFFGLSGVKGTDNGLIRGNAGPAPQRTAYRELEITKKYSFGGVLKAGIVINNTAMPFAKIGYASTKWELRNKLRDAGTVFNNAEKTKKLSERLSGLILGGGIELPLNESLNIGLEYTHTRYQSIKFNQTLNATNKQAFCIKPVTNDFHLTLKWKFYEDKA